MSVKCQVVMEAMERLAPRRLAEDWDNVGLMLGSPVKEIHKIYVCLDVNEVSVDQAVECGADLIISHHPLIFKPLQHLRTDLPQGRLIERLFRADLAVYAAHTNLDAAEGGVNDVLTERLALRNCAPLAPNQVEKLFKLAVFVPESHAATVREAMTKAGAGCIGNYSHCTFNVQGKGTFLPQEGTNPFIGTAGRLETVDEVRVETVLPEKIVSRVTRAMCRAHPYEEVAYDLYELKQGGKVWGIGRIGELDKPMSAREFAERVKSVLPVDHVRLVGMPGCTVRKIAVCGGAGAEFISKAAYAGADVLLTGDLKYHEAQKALELGIAVVDAGHFGTEMPASGMVAAYLEKAAQEGKWNVSIICDTRSKDIFSVV